MYIVKNPAKSRPLSANVRRLMKMARESPLNPNVEKIEREFTARDLAYCDMQGNIFMAAIDQGIAMHDFAPIFMNSQLAGVIDYSFSRAGGMEEDDIANYLRMPVLLKSPAIIVDTVMWLNEIVSRMNPGDNLNMAVYFLVLLSVAGSLWFRKRYRHPHIDDVMKNGKSGSGKTLAAQYWTRKEISLKDVAAVAGVDGVNGVVLRPVADVSLLGVNVSLRVQTANEVVGSIA